MSDFPTLKLEALVSGTEAVDDEEYELELRFELGTKVSKKQLKQISRKSIDIEQTYVDVNSTDGEKFEVRLRRTYESDGSVLRRIAYKHKIKNGDKERPGRIERQIQIKDDDPRTNDFERLFTRHKWRVLKKKRHYIFPIDSYGNRIILPGGSQPEIHYDTHGEPENPNDQDYRLEGRSRLEIEVHGNPNNKDTLDADWKFLKDEKNRIKLGIPGFVGEEVTNLPEYKSKALAEFGSLRKARIRLAKKKVVKGK